MKNDKISKESKNLIVENAEQIKKMFPEVVSEGKINFERLKLILGQELDDKEDSYTFNWAGRKDTFRNIQTTAKGTLVPDEKESINFKQTENIFIEGDNLEVLKLLQRSYYKQVKMIYIDPPYNTGHDFVYKDNFKNGIKAYLEQTGQLNGEGVLLTTNPESSGRFHSDWISMMYPRLFMGKSLLREDGVIFISIDDGEVYNLRFIMNEIFGEENFIGVLKWKKKKQPSYMSTHIAEVIEYIMIYAKDASVLEKLSIEKRSDENTRLDNAGNNISERLIKKGIRVKLPSSVKIIKAGIYKIKTMEVEYLEDVLIDNGRTINDFKIKARFRNNQEQIDFFVKNDVLFITSNKGLRRDLLQEEKEKRKSITDLIIDWGDNQESDKEMNELFPEGKPFEYPKPVTLIKNLIRSIYSEDSIILDFFAGSGTTAQAVLELNKEEVNGERRFILVQLPEKTDVKSEAHKQGYKTISDIAKERIRRVIKKLEKEEKTKLMKSNIDLGFKVFRLEKSNYKIWENYEGQDIKELTKQLDLFKSPLVNGYNDHNVIYECIIKEGLNLNAKIEKIDISGNTIYKASDGNHSFHICLDEKIGQENLNKLNLKKDDLIICLDSSLDDSEKVNISLQCKLKTL